MKNNKKKLGLVFLLVVALLLPTTASAYSGGFSFDISAAISGTKTHSLGNKSTSITSKANSYYSSGAISPNKESYSVNIVKSWLTSYGAIYTANGYTYTKSLGTVSSGTYTVDVNKRTSSSYGGRVKGNGTINQ